MKLNGRLRGISKVFQVYFRNFKGVSKYLREVLTGVLRRFQRCLGSFKAAERKYQVGLQF